MNRPFLLFLRCDQIVFFVRSGRKSQLNDFWILISDELMIDVRKTNATFHRMMRRVLLGAGALGLVDSF